MDVMMRRRELMMLGGGLPGAYRRVEWIGASGTQYIATSYIPSAGVSVDFKYMLTGETTGDNMFYGAVESTTKRNYAELYNVGWYCANGSKKYAAVLAMVGTTANTLYVAHLDNTSFSIGDRTASPTEDVSASVLPIYIFAWNNNGVAQYLHKVLNLYELVFKENGRLAANFIPCVRKSDNKPGMYDTVSKTFYTNAGTGEFIVPN